MELSTEGQRVVNAQGGTQKGCMHVYSLTSNTRSRSDWMQVISPKRKALVAAFVEAEAVCLLGCRAQLQLPEISEKNLKMM